ncbi:MAG: pyridoxine 5'-phosphate synthase [Candidatus Omnitrophota bacterium]
MPRLGVNIDHVATLRQARGEDYPDPVKAAVICEKAGADSIVCHLREDRRHIQDKDVRILRRMVKTRLNLEMSLSPEIIGIARRIKPDQATLVPEKRKELTTEGGLDAVKFFKQTASAVNLLTRKDIAVSLFIDPVKEQISAAAKSGAPMIELHTGCYANAKTASARQKQLNILKDAAMFAQSLGLAVHAGHGLKYDNAAEIAGIPGIIELNIGHSIIAQAVFDGLEKAVREMKKIIQDTRHMAHDTR